MECRKEAPLCRVSVNVVGLLNRVVLAIFYFTFKVFQLTCIIMEKQFSKSVSTLEKKNDLLKPFLFTEFDHFINSSSKVIFKHRVCRNN